MINQVDQNKIQIELIFMSDCYFLVSFITIKTNKPVPNAIHATI